MSHIRSKNTAPEMAVRRLIHAMGYRYRLHQRKLPGQPDLVFPSRRKVIFVHGCFWHQHEGCKFARKPKSNQEFWIPKFNGIICRDKENQEKLLRAGWNFLIIWECKLKNTSALSKQINDFLISR